MTSVQTDILHGTIFSKYILPLIDGKDVKYKKESVTRLSNASVVPDKHELYHAIGLTHEECVKDVNFANWKECEVRSYPPPNLLDSSRLFLCSNDKDHIKNLARSIGSRFESFPSYLLILQIKPDEPFKPEHVVYSNPIMNLTQNQITKVIEKGRFQLLKGETPQQMSITDIYVFQTQQDVNNVMGLNEKEERKYPEETKLAALPKLISSLSTPSRLLRRPHPTPSPALPSLPPIPPLICVKSSYGPIPNTYYNYYLDPKGDEQYPLIVREEPTRAYSHIDRSEFDPFTNGFPIRNTKLQLQPLLTGYYENINETVVPYVEQRFPGDVIPVPLRYYMIDQTVICGIPLETNVLTVWYPTGYKPWDDKAQQLGWIIYQKKENDTHLCTSSLNCGICMQEFNDNKNILIKHYKEKGGTVELIRIFFPTPLSKTNNTLMKCKGFIKQLYAAFVYPTSSPSPSSISRTTNEQEVDETFDFISWIYWKVLRSNNDPIPHQAHFLLCDTPSNCSCSIRRKKTAIPMPIHWELPFLMNTPFLLNDHWKQDSPLKINWLVNPNGSHSHITPSLHMDPITEPLTSISPYSTLFKQRLEVEQRQSPWIYALYRCLLISNSELMEFPSSPPFVITPLNFHITPVHTPVHPSCRTPASSSSLHPKCLSFVTSSPPHPPPLPSSHSAYDFDILRAIDEAVMTDDFTNIEPTGYGNLKQQQEEEEKQNIMSRLPSPTPLSQYRHPLSPSHHQEQIVMLVPHILQTDWYVQTYASDPPPDMYIQGVVNYLKSYNWKPAYQVMTLSASSQYELLYDYRQISAIHQEISSIEKQLIEHGRFSNIDPYLSNIFSLIRFNIYRKI